MRDNDPREAAHDSELRCNACAWDRGVVLRRARHRPGFLRRQAAHHHGRRRPGRRLRPSARVAARHLGRHIPGNPTIIVQNIPSRVAADNMMFTTAMKDGTTIALLQRGVLLARLLYPAGVRFDIEKFHWLGSLNSETAVTLAWHTAPHKTAKDLFDKELIVGGITGSIRKPRRKSPTG